MRGDVLRHRRVRDQPLGIGDPGLQEPGPEPRGDLPQVGAVDDLLAAGRLVLADRVALDARRALVRHHRPARPEVVGMHLARARRGSPPAAGGSSGRGTRRRRGPRSSRPGPRSPASGRRPPCRNGTGASAAARRGGSRRDRGGTRANQGVCTLFPSRTSGGGSRFQNVSKLVPVRSWADRSRRARRSAPHRRGLLDLGLVQGHVVAHVEGVARGSSPASRAAPSARSRTGRSACPRW